MDILEIRRLNIGKHLLYAYKIVLGLVYNAARELFTVANSVNATISLPLAVSHAYKLFSRHDRVGRRVTINSNSNVSSSTRSRDQPLPTGTESNLQRISIERHI